MAGETNDSTKRNSRETSPLETMSKVDQVKLGREMLEMALRNKEAGTVGEQDVLALSVQEATADALTKENETTMTPNDPAQTEKKQFSMPDGSVWNYKPATDTAAEQTTEPSEQQSTEPPKRNPIFQMIDEKFRREQAEQDAAKKTAETTTETETATPEEKGGKSYSDMSLPELYAARMKALESHNEEEKHKIDIAMNINIFGDKTGKKSDTEQQESGETSTALTVKNDVGESLVVVTGEDPSITEVKKAIDANKQTGETTPTDNNDVGESLVVVTGEDPSITEVKKAIDANKQTGETIQEPASLKDLSLDELTTKWAEALDNKDGETGKNIQDELWQRLRSEKNNISGNDKPYVDSHQHALMARIFAIAESKRQKGEPESEDLPDDPNYVPGSKKAPGETKPGSAVDAGEAYQPDNREEKPETPDKKNEEAEIKLELSGGISDDFLNEALRNAMAIDARLQNKAKFKNSHNIFKAIASRVKHNALFKRNTQVLKGKEILDDARLKAKEQGGMITFEQYKEVLIANGIEPNDEQKAAFDKQEQAFLGLMATEIEGVGGTLKDNMPPEFRHKITQNVLEYARLATTDPTISEEDRINLEKKYKAKISDMIREQVKIDPNTDPLKIEVYADNASQLLRNGLAIARHENGMQELEAKLQEMKISIGEKHIGPNNTFDAYQLEKVDKLSKKHNTTSVIGKASFVIGTWIATGVAAGLVVKGSRYTASSGITATAAACGSLLGPVGILVGITAGAGVAAMFARHMARRRKNEEAGLLAANVESDNGYALNRKGRKEMKQYTIEKGKDKGKLKPDLTPEQRAEVGKIINNPEYKKATTMEKMKPEQMSMVEATAKMRTFMEPKPGLPADYDVNDANNYQAKSTLTTAEKAEYAKINTTISDMLAFQSGYNKTAYSKADEMAKQGGFRKFLRTKDDADSRALNLFSASNDQANMPELYQMVTFLKVGLEAMKDPAFQATELELPKGDGTTEKVKISDYITSIKSGINTDIEANVADWQSRQSKAINKEGKKAAVIGGSVAFVAGLGANLIFAEIAKKITGEKPATWLDIFHQNSGNTGPKTPLDLNVTSQNGKLRIELPDGSQTNEVILQPDGSISPADEILLESTYGIKIDQSTSSIGTSISAGEALKNLGGVPAIEDADQYLVNGTRYQPDGTELTHYVDVQPDGSVVCKLGEGTAFETVGGQTYNVLEEVKNGNVFMRLFDRATGTRYISDVPYTVNSAGDCVWTGEGVVGEMVANNTISNWGPAIVKSDSIVRSLSDIAGHSGMVSTETFSTAIKAIAELPADIVKKAAGWFTSGVVTTQADSYLSGADGYGIKPGPKPEPPTPGPVPGPTPGPTPEPPTPGPANPTGTKKPNEPGLPDFPEAANAEDTDVINENPPGKTKPPYNYPIDPETTFAGEKPLEADQVEKHKTEYKYLVDTATELRKTGDKEDSALADKYDEEAKNLATVFPFVATGTKTKPETKPELPKSSFELDMKDYMAAREKARQARLSGNTEIAEQSEREAQSILDKMNSKKTTTETPKDTEGTEPTEKNGEGEVRDFEEMLAEAQEQIRQKKLENDQINPAAKATQPDTIISETEETPETQTPVTTEPETAPKLETPAPTVENASAPYSSLPQKDLIDAYNEVNARINEAVMSFKKPNDEDIAIKLDMKNEFKNRGINLIS